MVFAFKVNFNYIKIVFKSVASNPKPILSE